MIWSVRNLLFKRPRALNETKIESKITFLFLRGLICTYFHIFVNNLPTDRVSHFNYLCCHVSFSCNDIISKLIIFQDICQNIQRPLKRGKTKQTELKCYLTMTLTTLTYDSETWL